MPRILLAFCIGTCVLLGGTGTMEGQEQHGVPEYDARALRVENREGDRVVVRGRDGLVLGKIGGLRGGVDLANVVAPSENAVREARDFSKRARRGNWAMTVGLTAISVWLLTSRIHDMDPAVATAVDAASAGGLVLAVYGAVQLNKANTALGRSIWWYNRDLGR